MPPAANSTDGANMPGSPQRGPRRPSRTSTKPQMKQVSIQRSSVAVGMGIARFMTRLRTRSAKAVSDTSAMVSAPSVRKRMSCVSAELQPRRPRAA